MKLTISKKEKHQFSKAENIDILILHGMNNDLVNNVKKFLSALGLSADSAINLPKMHKIQENNVELYISSCKVPIIFVCFDEAENESKKPRSNVIDEIVRCQKIRKNDFIMFIENRDNKPVPLQSNLNLENVESYVFEISKLHEVYLSLFEICKRRGLVVNDREFKLRIDYSKSIKELMDAMDHIWVNEFDSAGFKIDEGDWDTMDDFQVKLDRFFWWYWEIFDNYFMRNKYELNLQEHSGKILTESWLLSADLWKTLADAKKKKIHNLKVGLGKNKKFDNHLYDEYFNEATKEIREAKKTHTNPIDRITSFKKAVSLLDNIMKELF